MDRYRIFRRTGSEDDEKEFPFMRGSSRNAWISAWEEVMSQLRTNELVDRATGVTL